MYTNRSPYPTVHLLRECDVSAAVEQADTDDIIAANAARMRAIGRPELQRRLDALSLLQ